MEDCGQLAYRPVRKVVALLRAYRPKIVHLHFLAAKCGYPWLAKLMGVGGIYMHDHISRMCPLCAVHCRMRGPCERETAVAVRSARDPQTAVPPGAASESQPGAVSSSSNGAIFPRDCVLHVRPWKRAANWLFCLPVTKMFCVSSFIHRCDVAYGAMPPRRLEVLYNGVDLDRAETGAARAGEFRRRHALPEDRVLVVQAGHLIQEKGVADLLRAAQTVLRDGGAVHFLVAGEGPRRQEFERLAGELGISSHVTFSGRVRDPVGEGLWATCDIACQVSRWQEAFGLTIAEAMASARPVIGTRTGAIPELIEDGRSGFLVEPGDGAALAEKIAVLARDPQRRQAMGQAGRSICQEKFSLRKNVADMITSYGIRTAAGNRDCPCQVEKSDESSRA
jgi:hypothetical protein